MSPNILVSNYLVGILLPSKKEINHGNPQI